MITVIVILLAFIFALAGICPLFITDDLKDIVEVRQ